RFFYSVRSPHLLAHAFKFARQPHGRAAEREAATEISEQVEIGAGHPAVQDIADDGDVQILDAAAAIADGEGIEERLSRMLVCAVAGIDDGYIQVPGHKIG